MKIIALIIIAIVLSGCEASYTTKGGSTIHLGLTGTPSQYVNAFAK